MFLSKTLGPGRHPYIVISFTLKVTDQYYCLKLRRHDPQMSQYSHDFVKIGTPNIESQI